MQHVYFIDNIINWRSVNVVVEIFKTKSAFRRECLLLMRRLLRTLWEYLEKQLGICPKTIWNKIVDLVVKTVLR